MTPRPAICFLENDGRFAPGDFNGDGATSVQDIFDFLVTQPTPGEVFDFLEAWYS